MNQKTKPDTQNTTTEQSSFDVTQLNEIKEQLKQQILEEMENKETRQREETATRQKAEKKAHDEYVERMKKSPDPWVDIVGWVQTSEGVKIELDWNDAFIVFLRESNISGADEEQVVQKWLTILLQDMSGRIDEEGGTQSSYE